MAAVAHTGDEFDLDAFMTAAQRALPSYARPVFLRLMPSVDTTGEMLMQTHTHTLRRSCITLFVSPLSSGTFKIQKTRLQREGFKTQDTSDKIYFLNSRAGRYEAVTDELYGAIMEERVCL